MTVSATEADWSREFRKPWSWAPNRALLKCLRDYQSASGPLAALRRKLIVIRHRFWSAVTGADIPLNSRIGGGLLLPHPNGVVIMPDCEIGPNCLFFQQVTIGALGSGIPTIGGHVDVGAGAKILGSVNIGDHARIGANAVVLIDVPPYATAVGNPARIIVGRRGSQSGNR